MSAVATDLGVDGSSLRAGDAQLRERVVHAAIGIFRVRALTDVTLADVATAAGAELGEVEAEFGCVSDLVIVVIDVWNRDRMTPLQSTAEQWGAVAFLRGIVLANIADPALMRLLTAMVNIAGAPHHPIAPVLQQQWVQFHAHVQRALARDIEVGREPSTMEPASGAEQLIAVYEGLQLQSIFRPNMDLLASFDRAVTRLRDGWSRAYAPPTWEI
jgi:AcrR family transcriptional regulator